MSQSSWALRYWLVGLLFVWAALLFGGFLFGAPDATGSQRIPTWARMASSFTLVVAGWSWFSLFGLNGLRPFRLLLALGMTAGFVGDLFLADLLPAGQAILGGMAAFACGHLCYIGAIVYLGNHAGLSATLPRWGSLGLWVLIGLAGWLWIVYPSSQPPPLRWAALGYVLLLASMPAIRPRFPTKGAGQSPDIDGMLHWSAR